MKSDSLGKAREHRLRTAVSGAAVLACIIAAGFVLPDATAAVSGPDNAKDPKFVKPVTEAPPPGTRVNVVASKITYDAKRKIATATGLVRIVFGPYTLTATKVVYDMDKDTFKANGSVVLQEPNGNVLHADYAEITKMFKEGFARHVKALLTNDVTITADYAKRTEDGVTVYERATYTACKHCVSEDGTPAWQIVARRATHDQQQRTIYYEDMKFEIAGVPVLWLPYLAYPDPTVTRRSGFLLPQFSSDKAFGYGITTPYFWALAPNADLTFSPRWTTKQGPVADVEWRHRLKNGLYDIHGYGVYQLDPQVAKDQSRQRGALTSRGEFKLNDMWSWGWNGTLLSDKSFLSDYSIDTDETNEITRDIITSDAHVIGLADRTYISAQALHYQTTLDEEDQDMLPTALPYVTAGHTFADPVFGGELGFEMNAYSLNRGEAVGAFDLGTDQTRGVANLHWQKQMINGMGQVITPFMQVRGDVYITENVPGAASDSETTAHLLPSAGIDVRWPFIASQGLGQSVLTPVVQVISATEEEDRSSIGDEDAITINFNHTNLFLQDRFTGLDRYEGGTRANAGLMYTFLHENGGFARMSLGESFHIAGDNSFDVGSGLDGPVSDLVGAIAFQPNERMRFTYEARAEENLSRINSQEASASLTLDRIWGSLSYADIGAAPRYGRPSNEEQVWGDAGYKLAGAWSLFGGLRYDVPDDRFINKYVGLLFECDCMNAKLIYSEFTDDDSGGNKVDRSLKLSVDFRTIGKIGGGFGF
ncbi:MAG: LPS-assembly protein LptD [Rhizobiales bacterium]|nr:LPS-assembly protein LptD [Hyphomicrobiales bacterium]